jgi:hypothetical protein
VVGRADGCVAASETAVVSCVCRRRRVVLAGGREDCAACGRRQGEAADAVRSRGVGSGAFSALVGMGVSLRSLPAASETQARILCFAAALADRVIGWGNLTMKDGALRAEFGYVGLAPLENEFKRELGGVGAD